jgi:hypothetical protein
MKKKALNLIKIHFFIYSFEEFEDELLILFNEFSIYALWIVMIVIIALGY